MNHNYQFDTSSPYDDENTICLVNISRQKQIAATRDRTRDLQIFSLTLSQLSYRGTYILVYKLITITGTKQPIRRRTHYLFGKHIKTETNCRDPGSNQGPSDLQSDALPTELSRHMLWLLTNESQLPEKAAHMTTKTRFV